ncbi:MAG: hypothetical protein C0494_17055 [Sphingobium sp.]|nr:hypothetical protein [Sphingobium sp.]
MGNVTHHKGYGTLYRDNEAIVDVGFKEIRQTTVTSTLSEYEITPAYGTINMNLGTLILRPEKDKPVAIILRRTDGKTYYADPAA